jgi:glycosyltransferase involved in cell wall biosynthesis
MRILMIAGVEGKAEAGAAGVVFNLTRELRGLGHTVKPMFFEDLLVKRAWPNRFRTVELASQIAKYVRKVAAEYDVVNIHAPFGFLYGASRRMRGPHVGPPYIMTMHGLEERRNYSMGLEAKKGRADYFRWKNRVWQHLYHMRTYRWSFSTANQCIVLNREAKLFLELKYNLPPDRVWFIPNGVGAEFFQRRSFPDGTATKLLFVGAWIDHKGSYYLPAAFEKVLTAIPDARLTIAGCQETEERVRRFFPDSVQRSLDVKRFVPRAEMPKLYAEHEIFVLPSLVEGMPLVLLEAMASGMPVVSTESSGMTDIVEDSHDGLFAIPGDVNSLSSAIVKLCMDSSLRQRLGSAAREKMERHTWLRMAQRHEAVFQRALGATSEISARPCPTLVGGEQE